MTTSDNLWEQTYKSLNVTGEPFVSVISVANINDKGVAQAISKVRLYVANEGSSADISRSLTPPQMREYAAMLISTADRIENELDPLVAKLNQEFTDICVEV